MTIVQFKVQWEENQVSELVVSLQFSVSDRSIGNMSMNIIINWQFQIPEVTPSCITSVVTLPNSSMIRLDMFTALFCR